MVDKNFDWQKWESENRHEHHDAVLGNSVRANRRRYHIARYDTAVHLMKKNNLKKDALVIDVASGLGYGTGIITKEFKCVGVDLDPMATKYSEANHQGIFVNADIANIPFADGHFDAGVCFETIEHTLKYKEAEKELFRVLKSGARLYLSYPNTWSITPYHLWITTHKNITELFKNWKLIDWWAHLPEKQFHRHKDMPSKSCGFMEFERI